MRINRARENQKKEAGFTLLLAALVASIAVALGASIFGIAQKELTLSSIGRDSQFAFYAADTAAECALYWDVRHDYFALTTPGGVEPICDSQTLTVTGHDTSYPYTMVFQFEPNGHCADVSVTKSLNASNILATVIRADGFSVDCASTEGNPRTLQRSVELHY